jgi:hypothetical protein
MVPVCAWVTPVLALGHGTLINGVLQGREPPTKSILKALGLEIVYRHKKIAPTAAGAKVHIAVPLTSAKNFSAPSLLNVPDS